MNNRSVIILSISILLAVAIIAAAGFFVSNKFYEAYQEKVDNEARFECAQSSRVEVIESETITGFYPAEQAYKDCLKEKGL